MEHHQTAVPYKLFRRFPIPKGADENRFLIASQYSPLPGDIFIVSHVKCGTTWLQHIVYLLLNRGKPPKSLVEVIKAIPFPEQDGMFPEGKHPIAIKYHLPFSFVPFVKEARYLYVARNPKDSCVSYYHFLKKLPGYHIQEFDEFLEAFMKGEVPYGHPLDHALPWFNLSSLPNVLFLTYESLSKNREENVRKIAQFLGLKELDEDIIKDVVKYSSFEFMRALECQDDSMKKYLNASTGKRSTENHYRVNPQMMRKGKVGDWRNYLSLEQSKQIDDYFLKWTKGTPFEHLWAEDMMY